MEDKLFLFCYDFPADKQGNKRRRKIVKILDGHGNRVQYSVFEARFTTQEELERVIKKIEKKIEVEEDSVRIYPMNRQTEKDIIILGYGDVFKREETYIF